MTLICKATLKRLAVEGRSQRDIARHFGCTHGAVSNACTRLGVKTRGNEFANRSRQGRKAARAGVQYLRLRGPVAAAKLGWPQARTLREAEILDGFFRLGPGTLQHALGRPPNTRDGERAADLCRRGLLVATGGGKGCRRPTVYRLALGVAKPVPMFGRGR